MLNSCGHGSQDEVRDGCIGPGIGGIIIMSGGVTHKEIKCDTYGCHVGCVVVNVLDVPEIVFGSEEHVEKVDAKVGLVVMVVLFVAHGRVDAVVDDVDGCV